MKKTLLTVSLALLGSTTLMAAAPEGNLYLLGLNGDNTASAANHFVMAERTEDDIDEGMWRWSIPSVSVTAETGTVTVSDNASFKLGFDADNEFGITNSLTATQSMVYLAPDGAPLNYNLRPGEYTVSLALFEDLDSDMGGDTWML